MNVADFDFALPPELIAQEPPDERGASRLLALDRATGRTTHHMFSDLPGLLKFGDLLVVNDTRVFPARLIGTRLPGGGAAECFLIRPVDGDTWIALVHPGQRLRVGSRMVFVAPAGAQAPPLQAEVTGMHFHG
ncbi:MAG: S-adenosylmethionine:tRNA ribosyltransferase-isomerase, partial [Vicinamibacterales bacterium]